MANVVCATLGGTPRRLSAETVGEARRQLGLENHTATVNGEAAGDETRLTDEAYVSFAPKVKGGQS